MVWKRKHRFKGETRQPIGDDTRTTEFMSDREILRDLHDRIIGTKEVPGIISRIERIEFKMMMITWVVVALLGGGITLFFDWIKTKLH